MNRKLSLVLMIALGLTLSACAGKKDQGTLDNSSGTVSRGGDSSGNAYGTGLSAQQLIDLGINGDPLNYKTVYFEYNSSAIDERSRVITEAHARHLRKRGGAQVSLQGHADERGTRDYNLALGERRAQSVAQLMSAVGAGNSGLQTISYGEERPADTAHNEAAWQLNRRVEISY